MQENTNNSTLSINEELAMQFCKIAANNGLSQVNPRFYKSEIITYYLKRRLMT